MDAAAFAGQVDRLHKSGQSGHELIARTGVDLPIGFGIGWIRSGRVQKLVAPVPCDAGLQSALVVISDRIGTVAEPRQRKLRHARRQAVVERRAAIDDRIVQDHTKTGVPEAVLKREFPAVDRRLLVAVDRRRNRSEENKSELQSLMRISLAV